MSIEDLVVYRKAEELLNKVYPRLVNYPKSEKFSLCQHIKENFFELLKYISLGNSVKSKRLVYLQEADGHLQVLKVLIKLSKSRKYISIGFFKEVDLELTEIKRNDYIYIDKKGALRVDMSKL